MSAGIYGNGNLTYHLYLEKNPLQHGEKEREKDMRIESKHCRSRAWQMQTWQCDRWMLTRTNYNSANSCDMPSVGLTRISPSRSPHSQHIKSS